MSSQQEGKPLLADTPSKNGGATDSGVAGMMEGAGEALASAGASVAKFGNQNKRFWNSIYLAAAIASWMTLFGLPSYSAHVEHALFGRKSVRVAGETVTMCKPSMMGFKINNGTKEKPNLVPYTHHDAANMIEPDVWCGVFPGTFFGAWPGVVQTAMFTLYVSTGTTVKLAWQCVAGTGCAVLNIILLSCLYPSGAGDPAYSEVVAWLDLLLVIFLFLASRADVNTMMMGICWSVCLMMHFMNPNTGSTLGTDPSPIPGINYDAETTVVMVTSFLGVVIAVLATIFPKPLMNIRTVHDDAEEIIKAIEAVLNDSINYYSGGAINPKRFQICGKIAALETTVKRVKGNLEDSYWETFNLCGYGKVRSLYLTFNKTVLKGQDDLYLIKASLMNIVFNDDHQTYVKALRQPLEGLKNETISCLKLCLQCCKDGKISDEEQKNIESAVQKIQAKLVDLAQKYQVVMSKEEQYVSEKLAADSLFVFSLSNWCRELQDWAADLSKFEENQTIETQPRNPVSIAVNQFLYVFDPKFMFTDVDNLRFTVMNAIPILITYAIALYSNGSVFIQYSATMPSTLAVLVTYDYGATFFKNLQRLMGVTFGKTLPLLLISVVSLMPCESDARLFAHAISIFLFYFSFTFMYYASDKWSTVGCLIGGFGCYTLFVPCSDGVEVDYGAMYKVIIAIMLNMFVGSMLGPKDGSWWKLAEASGSWWKLVDIAEVIIAIMLKMFIGSMLAPKEPRDLAVESFEVTFKTAFDGLRVLCNEGPQDGDKELDKIVKTAKDWLQTCQEFAPKCDPMLQLIPGFRTPFKVDLYSKAVDQMRLVLSDMDMLNLALTGHLVEHEIKNRLTNTEKAEEQKKEEEADKQEDNIFQHVSTLAAWNGIKKDLLDTVEKSFHVTLAVLKHATEEPLDSKSIDELKNMSNLMQLDGIAQFYKDVSKSAHRMTRTEEEIFKDQRTPTQLRRTRFVVFINSLSLATQHSAELAAACFESMIYC